MGYSRNMPGCPRALRKAEAPEQDVFPMVVPDTMGRPDEITVYPRCRDFLSGIAIRGIRVVPG